MFFIDVEKTYDRVPKVIWWFWKREGFPIKYVMLLGIFMIEL